MPKPPKADHCLNCGRLLDNYNFCPDCGQENKPQQLSMKILAEDFLSNYFAFDSKLGRSFHHFFLRPGYLTRRYNEGKRVCYVHPLRLYLVISVFFFFLLSYLLSINMEEASLQRITADDSAQISAIRNQGDSVERAELKELQHQNPGLLSPSDSVSLAENEAEAMGFKKILGWLKNEELTDDMVMDSLSIYTETKSEASFRLFIHQSRRVVQKDLDVFVPYVLKNLPLMMFLLLPVFALYLKMLFRNKPNLYIQHIIHALHLHSMAFLLLTLFLLIGWFSSTYFFWVTFLLVSAYAFLSMKNVYQQRWQRSLWKFMLLGMFYFTTLLFFVVIETAVSFFTF